MKRVYKRNRGKAKPSDERGRTLHVTTKDRGVPVTSRLSTAIEGDTRRSAARATACRDYSPWSVFLGIQRIQWRGKYNAAGDQRLSYSHLPGDEVDAVRDAGGAARAVDLRRDEDVTGPAARGLRLRETVQRARKRGQLRHVRQLPDAPVPGIETGSLSQHAPISTLELPLLFNIII